MNIPPKYEDVVANLDAAEVIIQAGEHVESHLEKQIDILRIDLDAALRREAALREELDSLKHWRDLALQFDNHRMRVLWHLKTLVSDGAHYEAAAAFLTEPPIPATDLQQRLTVAEQRDADNLKLISGLVEYAENLLADVNNAWIYAGSTGEPETHKDEDYAAALNLLSATVSSHE